VWPGSALVAGNRADNEQKRMSKLRRIAAAWLDSNGRTNTDGRAVTHVAGRVEAQSLRISRAMAVLADPSALQHIAQRLKDSSVVLAERWLDRVQELVTVSRMEVFPSRQLLDHIPEVIREIGVHVESPEKGSIESNRAILQRAAELGELRHMQHASVHQLLREYRILAELLEEFVEHELATTERPDPTTIVHVMRRVSDSVRVLQQQTIDTLVTNYMQTIERQTTQLRHFSRLVSHEIRQPLAVLQVIARALPVGSESAESARMMDIFDRSVTRLADVTGKLERLARVTRATDLLPSEQTVDLTEVAHDAAGQLADVASERGVEIRVHANLPVLRLDRARAELIFVNLIANGIKFSDPEKSLRYVEIGAGAGSAPSVTVRDNGVGMSRTRLQTVFREFVRAHAQREDDVRAWGLGLGLSLVRDCMDQANGFVRVDSLEGRGTTFKLTWPTSALVSGERRDSTT
jgi:signal transduction histidine kinase